MPYLMRVELPDVPGSLGRVASAIGEAGGDIEAIEIVDKLSARDENGVRHSLPRLIKYIREEAFAETFLARDGLHELMGIIMNHQGNILAVRTHVSGLPIDDLSILNNISPP